MSFLYLWGGDSACALVGQGHIDVVPLFASHDLTVELDGNKVIFGWQEI